MKSFISQREKTPEIGKYISPKSTPENVHGLSQKIQGTYFKTSALYFKIYALYFSPFGMAEKQQLTNVDFYPFLSRFSAAQERLSGLPKQTYGI